MPSGSVKFSSEAQETQINMPENQHWKTIFRKYDLDGDQRISLGELQTMISSESYENDIPEHTVRMIMQKADQDENGYIDMEEFEKMVHSKEFRGLMSHMLNVYVKAAVVPRKSYLNDDIYRTGDYEEEYSCRPPTLFMIIVSALEFITLLCDIISVKNGGPKYVEQIFLYNPSQRFEVWRFVTYMFVHNGILHFIGNILVQILLGVPLEMVHKWWRVLIIYLSGVLAGSLGTSVLDPKTYLVGASGGDYALITAHMASIIMNWSEMRFALLQLVVILTYIAVDFGKVIYQYCTNHPHIKKIGIASHLAGALAGLLVGINVLRNLQVRQWERVVWWISLIVYCILVLIAIIWNVAYPSYFPN